MIDLLVTGHGHFSSGLVSAAHLIIGNEKTISYIDFTDDLSPTQFNQILNKKIGELSAEYIIILCDLIGGTPYKGAVTLSANHAKKIYIIGGVNLPLLIEASLLSKDIDDINNFIDIITSQGRASIDKFELTCNTEQNDETL